MNSSKKNVVKKKGPSVQRGGSVHKTESASRSGSHKVQRVSSKKQTKVTKPSGETRKGGK